MERAAADRSETHKMSFQLAQERASATPERIWREEQELTTPQPLTGMIAIDGTRALLSKRVNEATHSMPEWFYDSIMGRFIEFQFFFTRALVLELRIARLADMLIGDEPQERYASFIRLLGSARYQSYFAAKYLVLDEYVATQISHYIDAATTILGILVERFGSSRPVASVQFVGDPHNYGKQGAVVRFSDDEHVVVKPRSTTFDIYIEAVLNLTNPYLKTPLRSAKVEPVGSYLVSEWLAEVAPVPESAYAFGAWIALAQYHNLLDLHFENFVSTADGPVPVDFECCFSPSIRVDRSTSSSQVQRGREPLWRAGLLPRAASPSTVELRWSPLANNAIRDAGSYQFVEEDGTDEAHLQFRPAPDEDVVLASTVLSTNEDFDELGVGFEHMQAALASNVQELLRLRDAYQISDARTRLVRKPTRFYFDVLRRSFHPRFLVDPEAHLGVIRELIVRSGDAAESVAGRFEIGRLRAGFIPAYFSQVGSTEVSTDDQVVDQRIISGLDAHNARLGELNDESLLCLDRRSLRQLLICLAGAPWEDLRSLRPPQRSDVRELDAIEKLRGDIRKNLWTGTSESDHLTWQNIIDGGDSKFTVEEASFDLYNGAAGTALALLASAPDTSKKDSLVQRVIDDVVVNTMPWLLATGRFGSFSGAAGSVYTIWNAYTNGYVSREVASDFTTQVLGECVSQCNGSQEWDFFSGRAGLLLLLARLRDSRFTDACWCEPLASQLIEGLHETRMDTPAQAGAWWPGPNMDEGTGGLAHGVAGVALSTSYWLSIPGAKELHSASVISQNGLRRGSAFWRDTRPYVARELANAWCHGAAGILLADESKNSLASSSDLETWSRELHEEEGSVDFTLCHGLAGQTLAEATLLGRDHPHTRRHADQLRTLILSGWSVRGGHLLELSDSLFLGQAGALLSLAVTRDGYSRVGNPFLLTFPGSA